MSHLLCFTIQMVRLRKDEGGMVEERRFPAHATVTHLLDWAVVLVQKPKMFTVYCSAPKKTSLPKIPLDVISTHQGGLGRGHFHLRTWGQASRLVWRILTGYLNTFG